MKTIDIKYALSFLSILAIMVYVIWFLLAHSTPMTLSDGIVLFGGFASISGFFLAIIMNQSNSRLSRVERKLGKLADDVSFIKGNIN